MTADNNGDGRAFGDRLRRAREARGVPLRTIADATRISLRFLEGLEEGHFDVLPGGIFARSFLRQYADHLGLDTEDLVKEIDALLGEPVKPPPRRSAGGYLREHRGNLAIIGIMVAVGALTLVKVGVDHETTAAVETPRPAAIPVGSTPVPARRPDDRVYPPPVAAAAASGGLRLSLTAREDCWVAVVVDGQTVIDRTLFRGESQTFEAHDEILLSVGNAGGLSFTVNDAAGISLGRPGEVRRNILMTRDNLSAFVQNAAAMRFTQRS